MSSMGYFWKTKLTYSVAYVHPWEVGVFKVQQLQYFCGLSALASMLFKKKLCQYV